MKDFLTPRIEPEDQKLEPKTVFDDENNSYLLLFSGWKSNQRVHSLLIHIEIIGDKIWIQEDNTEKARRRIWKNTALPKTTSCLAFNRRI